MTNKSYPKKINIVEVGPRDGLQNEKEIVSTENKIKFIDKLSESGLKNIEAASFVSPKAIPQLADSSEVIKGIKKAPGVIYSALVPNMRGLERAIESGIKRIAIFTAASETFNKNNINMTIDESIKTFDEVVEKALKNNISVRGYVSTCFVCPYEGNIQKEKVLEVTEKLFTLGVDEVSIGDTIGAATPKDVFETVGFIISSISKEKIALHFHDTYGTALANVGAGLELGITTYDSSSGGLGGCPYAPGASGNLATEDLIDFLNQNGIESGVDLKKVSNASLFIEEILGRQLPSKVLKKCTR